MDIVLGLLALSMLFGLFLAVALGMPVILWREFRFERRFRQATPPVPASAPGAAQPVPRRMPDGMQAVLRLLEEQRRCDYAA